MDVRTVEELGRLRETLRASPSIAQHIRSFYFNWTMDGDYGMMELYDESEGRLVDLAFRDRVDMWEQAMWEHNGHPMTEGCSTGRPDTSFYDERDWTWYEPGCPEDPESYDGYYNSGLHIRGDGPDGNGEDLLIKNASDLESCVLEIVSQLTRLVTFGWDTPVFPVSVEVGAVLEKLCLATLHLRICPSRVEVHKGESSSCTVSVALSLIDSHPMQWRTGS